MVTETSRTAPPRDYRARRSYAVAWGSVVAIGVLLIVLGVFALGSTFVTGLITIGILGALLVGGGIAEMIGAFRLRRRGFAAPFLAGLLSALVGALVIWQPIAGLAAATLMITLYYVASGLFRAITAVVDRYHQWGWDFALGVIVALLGGYLLAAWPVTWLVLIGAIVGIELVFRGVAWIAGGFALRRLGNVTREVVAGGPPAGVF